MQVVATPETFDEDAYLFSNPDVAAAVLAGAFKSGREHFEIFGKNEKRQIRLPASRIQMARGQKLEQLRSYLRTDMPFVEKDDGTLDFLSDELRAATGIVATRNVSTNGYDTKTMALIEKHRSGLILDCGSGRCQNYYSNVVNFEIVDYDTTDVLGVGEQLPFVDCSFDAVLSIAVLEHVRDPFVCAREIARVLKPGGDLYCSVPFLQPYHGYPHHYFNATHQGIRRLFEDDLRISAIDIPTVGHPAFSLQWFLSSWRRGLPDVDAAHFEEMKVKDLLALDPRAIATSTIGNLPEDSMRELACSFTLEAVKV